MRNIVVGMLLSLDGIAEAPDLEVTRSEISPTGYLLVDYRVLHTQLGRQPA